MFCVKVKMTSSYHLGINKSHDCEGFETIPDKIKLSNEFKAVHSRNHTLYARYVVPNFRANNLMEHGADIAVDLPNTRILQQNNKL